MTKEEYIAMFRPASPRPRHTRAASTRPPLPIRAGLEPHLPALDADTAAHFLRRTGFGARPDQIAALVGMDAGSVVDSVIDDAVALPLPDPPVWAESAPPNPTTDPDGFNQYVADNNEWANEYRFGWIREMYSVGFRERMAFFWHNHFVTSISNYILAPFAHRYVSILRTHALGDFKQFVHDIGADAAMLIYLDGISNNVSQPNENYARELLELFTMGQQRHSGASNYTESDIQEIARALTGWQVNYFQLSVNFNPLLFDAGQKTFFNNTGNFSHPDVVNIIFQERAEAVAEFICRKLYQEFVYEVADEAIVAELAQNFVTNSFDIASVLRVLLKSAHFFDETVRGSRIKSPVEMQVAMLVESMASYPDTTFDLVGRIAFFLNQIVLNPPNVAGWPGYHSWVDTTALPIRWIVPDFLLTGGDGTMLADLVPLAETAYDPQDPLAAFYLPRALAELMFAVPLEELDIKSTDNDFAGDLLAFPIPPEVLNEPEYVLTLAKAFLAGTPWYEWSVFQQGAGVRIYFYLRYLMQLPEYQLT
jgi:uncharacterized protein (DUF1800 family)